MAKKFFFVCGGILMLVLAYHFGATSATAQAPSNPIVAGDYVAVITANGDVYSNSSEIPPSGAATWVRAGNVFAASGPTPAQPTTFGAIKAKFRR
jgi:hypothetical protein